MRKSERRAAEVGRSHVPKTAWKLGHLQASILKRKGKVKDTQSCLTLCDPMDYTVHGILQARILEWVAYPFSRGSSQLRNRTGVSCIEGRFFTNWAVREVLIYSEVVKFANKCLSELPPTQMWLRRSRWYCHFPVAKKKDRAVITQDYLLSLFLSLAKFCLEIFQVFVKPDYSVNYEASEDLPAIVPVLKPLEKIK